MVTPLTLTDWFGWPLTLIVPPLTVSPVISELPAALAPPAPSQVASAWDRRRTAWMELPAAFRFTPATDAAELLRLP